MDTGVLGIITALVAIISTATAAVFARDSKTQGILVTALQKQADTCEVRNDKLIADNRTNTETIFKMATAVEKLTTEQSRLTAAVGDLVYGRTEQRPRP